MTDLPALIGNPLIQHHIILEPQPKGELPFPYTAHLPLSLALLPRPNSAYTPPVPLQKAAQTVERHLTGIHNWMRSKINNGILEGLNSIIQAAKRKARGYGKKHFATIAFLLTGKLNLQKVNPFLPTRFG